MTDTEHAQEGHKLYTPQQASIAQGILYHNANTGSTSTYQHLILSLGLTSGCYANKVVSELLTDLFIKYHEKGWPPLTASVVSKNHGMPGEKFFSLLRSNVEGVCVDDQVAWSASMVSITEFFA